MDSTLCNFTGREIEPGPEIDGEMLVSRPGSFRLFTWLFPFYPSHFIRIDVHLFLVAQPDNLQFFSGFGAVRVDFYSVSQVSSLLADLQGLGCPEW